MNKKVKIVQWDEQGIKQFKSFLKQMYGEYGKINKMNHEKRYFKR